jgi:hypothetical protein
MKLHLPLLLLALGTAGCVTPQPGETPQDVTARRLQRAVPIARLIVGEFAAYAAEDQGRPEEEVADLLTKADLMISGLEAAVAAYADDGQLDLGDVPVLAGQLKAVYFAYLDADPSLTPLEIAQRKRRTDAVIELVRLILLDVAPAESPVGGGGVVGVPRWL